MEIKVTQHDGYTSFTPVGDLDANSSMLMDEKIQSCIDNGIYNLHVDCSELKYISSAGLGVFISFMDELQVNSGKFVFSDMSESVHKVFQLLGLVALMEIVGTKEEAQKAFSS